MSKSTEKATAILLGCSSPAFPIINFQSLFYTGLSEYEQAYVKVSVVAPQMYHHSDKEINAHFAGHLWHDFSTGDFIQLFSNPGTAVSNLKKSPYYPCFPPPSRMHLCPGKSKFITSTILHISSNNEDEQMADSYKGIKIFLQRYMGNNWSLFMKKLPETKPSLTELQKLVATKAALFMKANIFQLCYIFMLEIPVIASKIYLVV